MAKRRLRAINGEELREARFRDLMYADDVLTANAHPSINKLKTLAVKEAEGKPGNLSELQLNAEPSRAKNFIASPASIIHGVFRRQPAARHRGILQTRGREDEINLIRSTPDREGVGQSEHELAQQGLPYQHAEAIKILGITSDHRFCFEQHVEGVMERAKTRLMALGT